MKKIRIGNDIKIIWSIKTKDGQDYILDGKNLTVKAFRILGAVSTPISFETFGNTLTCWFYGKDQTKLGVYGLVLVENEGREDMHTVDSCDAFQLVARSCDVDGAECGCGNVKVESVELTSTLSADVFSHGIPAGGSAGQVLSKKSDEDYDTEWVDAPQGGGDTVDIVDNLTTADPTKALSANMGRTLNEKFQYKNYLAGKNLDKKGNILDAKGWNVTTPIAVVGGTALTFECGGTNTSALCEYDANGNFLDYWGQSVHPRTFTTKANTAYVRLAVPNNPTQDYFVAQNDVVLFNKLRNFDIVEQVANLDEAAIEVTPLLSIENDIYPPHMRLIVEWSNEDAEVLQPVSYNAETNLFEVESMPSWLAEDGVIVPATINYSDTILWGTGGWQNVPFPKNNTQTVQHIKRVSATTFMALSHSAESSNQMDIIASPDCTLFSYCQAKDVQRLPLQLDGEELSGIKKFKIVIKDSNLHLAKTFCGVNSSSTMLLSNNYNRVLGAYLAETRPLMVSGYMIIEVDFDNAQYRYLEYQLSGLSRTGVQTVTPYVQMSKNTEQWSSIWPNTKPISQAFFLLPANALTKKCNVKIYEIYE